MSAKKSQGAIASEQIVRALCDAFSRRNVDEILGFFTPDAVYEKIPVGRFAGHQAIRGTLEEFFQPGVTVEFEIMNLLASDRLVCVERLIHFETPGDSAVGATKIALPAMAIFEVSQQGKVVRWRDYFDRGQAGLR